ncbi:methyl-accepting chemotaxis protein [Sphingomonas sp. VL_57B]|jgi:methyl-accepting chemotaxis protein|uniref:methyl-accepting chemotaxis protein n=1 Tax=Sphingomonas sp. VL_57B TaxID=3144220 RepID=UPI0031F4D188
MSLADPLPAPGGTWLTERELNPPLLTLTDTMWRAAELFGSDPELRLVAIVDAHARPLGAIFEKDVRRLLLNPFGHALMRNPSYGAAVSRYVRACPVAEMTDDLGRLMERYRASGGSEGMILTRGGRVQATMNNRRLVHLAAEREVAMARAQVERAARIEAASKRFEAQVEALSRDMGLLSTALEDGAVLTADRASGVGDRALAVATAASQTSDNMAEIAARGRDLAGALAGIAHNTSDARQAAAAVSQLVETGSARTRDLLHSAQSIDSVIRLISDIARQVNLLALNATIEAARAGEAGRGFTVVANEVKQLSTQTGIAADRITAHVREIRGGIDEVAAGHNRVEQAIGAMAALADAVESAVARQEEATRTIARNVDEAVHASTGIQRDVEAIGGTSRDASDQARAMRDVAGRLHVGADALSDQVHAFLAELRVA